MALKYDWDIVIPALKKAQEVLRYAKGDCRNTKAMEFLDDCIDSMNTWIENAKPREEEPIINSRKPIKSGFAKRNAQMIMEKLGQCDGIVKTCISICPDSRLEKELEGLQENIVDVAGKAEMLSNGDEHIQSSRRLIKSSTYKTIDNIVKNYESWSGFDMEPACKNCAKALKDAGFNKSDVQNFFYKDGIYNEETGEGTWDKDYVECVLKNINSSAITSASQMPVDEHEVNEIALTVVNDGDIQPKVKSVIDNLKRKIKNGSYNKELSYKLWQYVADEEARKIKAKWGGEYSPATRYEAAKQLAEHYDEDLYED